MFNVHILFKRTTKISPPPIKEKVQEYRLQEYPHHRGLAHNIKRTIEISHQPIKEKVQATKYSQPHGFAHIKQRA